MAEQSDPSTNSGQAKAEVERLKTEINFLQESLKTAREIIYEQHHELERLRKALSHS